jgi:general secretion pathway protein M
MTLLPPKGQGQVLALCLLFFVAVAIYMIGFRWAFVAHDEISGEMAELAETSFRFRQLAGQREQLEQRLTDIRAFESQNTYFLPESSFDLAAAGLSTRLKQVITDHARKPDRCQVLSSQNNRIQNNDPYQRVTVQIRMRCEMEDFARVLHALENGTPLLFVDELNIYQQPVFDMNYQQNMGSLDATFNLSGYIRQPTGSAAG